MILVSLNFILFLIIKKINQLEGSQQSHLSINIKIYKSRYCFARVPSDSTLTQNVNITVTN